MLDGELVFTYKIGNKKYVSVRGYYNEQFTVLTLEGTVMQTDWETVNIHLDIDEKQGVTYPYDWIPITGNLMYLEGGSVVLTDEGSFEREFWDPIQGKKVTLKQDYFPHPLRDPDDLGVAHPFTTKYGGLKYGYDKYHYGYDFCVPHKGSQSGTRTGQPKEPFIPIVSMVDSV